MIEAHLSTMEDEEYSRLLARLIQSLVRADPEKRDPEEAERILKQLEDLAEESHSFQ